MINSQKNLIFVEKVVYQMDDSAVKLNTLPNDWEKYTDELKNIFFYMTNQMSQELPVVSIDIYYFILAIMTQKRNDAYRIMDKVVISSILEDITAAYYKDVMDTVLIAVKPNRKCLLSLDMNLLLNAASSTYADDQFISSAHLLMTILGNSEAITSDKKLNNVKKTFERFGLSLKMAEEAYNALNDNIPETDTPEEAVKIIDSINKGEVENVSRSTNRKLEPVYLSQYCTNLNDSVKKGKIFDVIGRENEKKEIYSILGRKNRHNVMILGENGVGKTALAQSIAFDIVNDKAPKKFKGFTIYALNVTALMAGTTLRGMLEERIARIGGELSSLKNAILFIDDIGIITEKDESQSIADMLMPYIDNGDIMVIGTADYESHKKRISRGSPLGKRFQTVTLSPMSVTDSIEVVRGVRDLYENYHNVDFPDKVVETLVALADRYVTDRFLPASAIDIMDETGSRVDRDRTEDRRITVTEDDVRTTITERTNIPVEQIGVSEKERILNLEDKIKGKIIGQDKAVASICKAIKRARLGLRNRGCLFSAMFIGKTGVGKTLLAKKLAEYLFGDEKNLIRLDMSEYADETSVGKLIGANPGYVGYDKGGVLTEAVKQKRYCILLLDEIEKADQKVYNTFLQVLDEGFLTDNTGYKVDFKNVVVIFTSNVGTKAASEFGHGIGFSKNEGNEERIMKKELKRKFPMEFINRLDEVIYFNSLTNDDIKKIVSIELNKSISKFNNMGYKLSCDDSVVRHITDVTSEDKDFGARPVLRAIETTVEDFLADQILEDKINKKKKYKLSFQNSSMKIS